MARISTYIKDSVVTGQDFVIGSDGDNLNRTSQFSVDALATYINRGLLPENLEKFDLASQHTTRLLYGYSDENGETPDLYEADGTTITPKYAGQSDSNTPQPGAADGVGQDGPFGVTEEQAKPPYFRIVHGLETSNIDINILRRVSYTTPTVLWTSSNTSDTSGAEPNTSETELLYVPYAPNGSYIVDDNTVDVNLGPYDLYDVIVVITGNLNTEA